MRFGSKNAPVIVFLSAVAIGAVGVFMISGPSSPALRTPSSVDDAYHPFDPELVRKIVQPDSAKGERSVQHAVVPRAAILAVLQHLDRDASAKGDLAARLELNYGIHPLATSHYSDRNWTFAQYKGQVMGVAPNCFVCHAGRLENEVIVGLGNTRVDLRAFFTDLTYKSPTAWLTGLPDTLHNISTVFTPPNSAPLKEGYFPKTRTTERKFVNRTAMMLDMARFVLNPELQSISAGHSNPWSFAVQLFKWRDNNMDYLDASAAGRDIVPDRVVLDPMPWWLLKYKTRINWDGIIPKSPRAVVQAAFSPGNDGAEIRAMEPLFNELYAAMHAMQPPPFPRRAALDPAHVAQGEARFNVSCAKCHGVYSEEGKYRRDPDEFREEYPEKIVPVSVIGTDTLRLTSINEAYLQQLQKSWLAFYDRPDMKFRIQREGYLAPPLWGIWASAPYFHNGSVPNLRALLFPERRPDRWRVSVPEDGSARTDYDYENVGLRVDENPPADAKDSKIYDTTLNDGRSKQGHERIFEKLSEEERFDVLEYLKTL